MSHALSISQLQDRNAIIKAPRELVIQMLSSMGNGSLEGNKGEGAQVMERKADDHLIIEFRIKAGGRVWGTVEEDGCIHPPVLPFTI